MTPEEPRPAADDPAPPRPTPVAHAAALPPPPYADAYPHLLAPPPDMAYVPGSPPPPAPRPPPTTYSPPALHRPAVAERAPVDPTLVRVEAVASIGVAIPLAMLWTQSFLSDPITTDILPVVVLGAVAFVCFWGSYFVLNRNDSSSMSFGPMLALFPAPRVARPGRSRVLRRRLGSVVPSFFGPVLPVGEDFDLSGATFRDRTEPSDTQWEIMQMRMLSGGALAVAGLAALTFTARREERDD